LKDGEMWLTVVTIFHVTKFKVNAMTELGTLMRSYCKHHKKPFHNTRFLYGGQRINAGFTPSDYGMKSGDAIDCFAGMM